MYQKNGGLNTLMKGLIMRNYEIIELAIKDNHSGKTLGYIKIQDGKYYKSQDDETWEECSWLETLMFEHDKGLRRLINE